jgi:cytochrome b involved in lipid metabolism
MNPKDLPAPIKRRRYYTPTEVKAHNTSNDCWVVIFDEVYDITELVQKNYSKEVEPITKAAGTDISHWFDKQTKEVKIY